MSSGRQLTIAVCILALFASISEVISAFLIWLSCVILWILLWIDYNVLVVLSLINELNRIFETLFILYPHESHDFTSLENYSLLFVKGSWNEIQLRYLETMTTGWKTLCPEWILKSWQIFRTVSISRLFCKGTELHN